MGKFKNYVAGLAETLGKDFEDITQEDIDVDFSKKAQDVWNNPNSTMQERVDTKDFLPKKKINDVVKYDEQSGYENFANGDVMTDTTGKHFLIIE